MRRSSHKHPTSAMPARVSVARWGVWLLLILMPAGLAAAQDVRSEQVQRSIQQGLAWLRRQQAPDGSWPGGGHPGGATALCTLALLNAGVPADDPAVIRALKNLQEIDNQRTYVVSLKAQAFAATDEAIYRRSLSQAVAWLVDAQRDNGMWGYGKTGGSTDNSNTQFALLGLHEAAKAGVRIPRRIWQQAAKHYADSQNADGGWGYRRRGENSYGSMTAAGVASLFICGQSLHVGGAHVFVDGAYPGCGRYRQNVVVAKAMEWLTRNFTVETNPGRRAWKYYYLYALERVGMISGVRMFGRHDWYRAGAAELVGEQGNDGAWGNQTTETAFCLLFLAKGNRPVLFQKVQWEGDWNRNINDLEHLTVFIGERLGEPTTWQATSLDVPLEQLRQSPVLFITGHTFPNFTPTEKQKLKDFVDRAGGTLLFEACCGSEAFADGFQTLAEELWPNRPSQELPVDHPVFHSHFDLETSYGLQGLAGGCRTAVFFSPRALSCLWELRDIPVHSELAFKLGTNIAAYASGREPLLDRLEVVRLPAPREDAERTTEVPRGAIRIARLIHDGDYNADPHAMVNLAALLRDRANVNVVARSRHVRVTDAAMYEYPILFMTGHNAFSLSDEELAALRRYLQRGGVLLAEACCGREAFDASMRQMAQQLFPEAPFAPLAADHPIYRGDTGVDIGELACRPAMTGRFDGRTSIRPPLESVTIDGRTVILYSQYDWSCSLEGDRPYSCAGYTDEDGRRLALALLLYLLNY